MIDFHFLITLSISSESSEPLRFIRIHSVVLLICLLVFKGVRGRVAIEY